MKIEDNFLIGKESLALPRDIVESPMLIAGMRGWGKTQFVRWLIEQLESKGINVIVLDSEGDYDFGNIVEIPDSGWDGIIRDNIGDNCTLDISGLSYLDKMSFSATLIETLCGTYNKQPTVLVMEEAHHLIPEKGRIKLKEFREAQNNLLYWTLELAAVGRHRNLGYIVVCRRKAEIAKDVVNQCNTLILARMNADDAKDFGMKPKTAIALESMPLGDYIMKKDGKTTSFHIDYLERKDLNKPDKPISKETRREIKPFFSFQGLQNFSLVSILILVALGSLLLGRWLGVIIFIYLFYRLVKKA